MAAAHTPACAGLLLCESLSVTLVELRTRWVSEQADSCFKLCFVDTMAIRKEFDFYIYTVLCFLCWYCLSLSRGLNLEQSGVKAPDLSLSLPHTGVVGAHCHGMHWLLHKNRGSVFPMTLSFAGVSLQVAEVAHSSQQNCCEFSLIASAFSLGEVTEGINAYPAGVLSSCCRARPAPGLCK